jgi:Calcineurin-like phosphoesterase
MPDPARLLRTFQQATTASRATHGRRGRLVQIGDAIDVLATGDLHGNLENFRRILVAADLANHPGRHLVLQELIHGPNHYPDGGDKSHQLVDLLAALKCQYPERVHMLLGNHELAQWRGQTISKSGGELTALYQQGMETAYGIHARAIYEAHLNLFAALPLAIRTANRVFLSHSLPQFLRADSFQPSLLEEEEVADTEWRLDGSLHSLLWGRDTSEETVTQFLGKVDADLLISGHIAAPEGYDVPNSRQLILDSAGAVASYCLFPAQGTIDVAALRGLVQWL